MMMDRENLRDMVSRLEALEALTKLFNTLWFDQIKKDIRDEKVQAYLMVFEDAFPHMNHVIDFVRRSAELLSDGEANRDQWASLETEFAMLHQLLTGEGAGSSSIDVIEEGATDLTGEEKEALESVGQDDIDSLFSNGDDAEEEEEDIDDLFDDDTGVDMEEEEISIAGEMIDEGEDIDEEDALVQAAALEAETADAEAEEEEEEEEADEDLTDLLDESSEEADADDDEADLLEESSDEEDGDEDLGDLLEEPSDEEEGGTEELAELLEGVDEEDVAEGDVELEELLDDDGAIGEAAAADEEDVDVEDLFDDDDADVEDAAGDDDDLDIGDLVDDDGDKEEDDVEIEAGISEDEMSALLDGGEEADAGEEAEEESEEEASTEDGKGEDGEELSEDEIDALFG